MNQFKVGELYQETSMGCNIVKVLAVVDEGLLVQKVGTRPNCDLSKSPIWFEKTSLKISSVPPTFYNYYKPYEEPKTVYTLFYRNTKSDKIFAYSSVEKEKFEGYVQYLVSRPYYKLLKTEERVVEL